MNENSIFLSYNYKTLSFLDFVVEGDDAWFCNIYYNALFHIDLKTFNIKLETFLPSLRADEYDQYMAIGYKDNRIIMAPCYAKDVLIYDINSKQIHKIEIDMSGFDENNIFNLFCSVKVFENTAYLFPGRYRSIVRIDLKTFKVEYINGWYDLLQLDSVKSHRVIFKNVVCNEDGLCMLPCWQKNIILKFDMSTKKFEIFNLKNYEGPLANAVFDQSDMWFSMRDKNIVVEHGVDQIHYSFDMKIPELKMRGGFLFLFQSPNYIYCVPEYGNMIIKFNKISGESQCIKKLIMEPTDKMKYLMIHNNNFLCCKMINSNEVIMYSQFDGMIYKINLTNDTFTQYEAKLSRADDKKVKSHIDSMFVKKIQIESQELSLTDYLDVVNRFCNKELQPQEQKNYGKAIYKSINNLIK